MNTFICCRSIAVALLASATLARAEETVLFNGKDLEGWSFHVRDDEQVKQVEQAWVVQEGLLVSTGLSASYLLHKAEFEDHILTLEWRSMKARNGLIVGGLGSVFIHTTPDEGAFHYPHPGQRSPAWRALSCRGEMSHGGFSQKKNALPR